MHKYFDILNRLGVNYQSDRRTDRWTELHDNSMLLTTSRAKNAAALYTCRNSAFVNSSSAHYLLVRTDFLLFSEVATYSTRYSGPATSEVARSNRVFYEVAR